MSQTCPKWWAVDQEDASIEAMLGDVVSELGSSMAQNNKVALVDTGKYCDQDRSRTALTLDSSMRRWCSVSMELTAIYKNIMVLHISTSRTSDLAW